MGTRRQFIVGTASAAPLMPLSGCKDDAAGDYERAEAQLHARTVENPGILDLVRLATLAPSGHNTQPRRFTPTDTGIRIRPDLSRCTPVVDPDDHHLFVSLSCAAENFLIAAAAIGRPGNIAFAEGPKDHIDIELAHGRLISDALYPAIVEKPVYAIELRQQKCLHPRPKII